MAINNATNFSAINLTDNLISPEIINNAFPADFKIIIAIIAFLFSGIIIDLITLFIALLIGIFKFLFGITKKKKFLIFDELGISIIIPAFNEQENIAKSISSAFNQTNLPKEVIVIDDASTDNTIKECYKMKKKYPNLKIISQKQNRGKAYNITYVLNNYSLKEVVIILDADTQLERTYLQEIIKPFADRRVVVATGISLPLKAKNFFGKIIFYGATFQYRFFCFRKRAHSIRNAISVITGDSAAYRKSFLKEVGGLPQGTQTEDMDLTWLALEKGYKVKFQQKALARSNDPSTLRGHWKQITRWYCGAFQCVIRHNKNLLKAKSLFYTTLLPFSIDSFAYAFALLSSFFLLFLAPLLAISFLISDLTFTLLAILYLDWKLIFRLPQIYIIKFTWAFAWYYSAIKTGIQLLFGKTSWAGNWERSSFYKKRK